MYQEKIIPRILFFTMGIILLVAGFSSGAEKIEQTPHSLPQPDVPKPQFFCGYCHILTYPGIMQKSFDTWEKSKHNKIFCVQCHYPPKKSDGSNQAPWEGEMRTSQHIPKKPPEHFSYLPLGGETVRTKPTIPNANCVNAGCHGKPNDKFRTKRIQFKKNVVFVHQIHFEKKNRIGGQEINCTNCHQHESELNHFEVSKAQCILCHFHNAKFNEGRGRCELCHKMPDKPITTSDAKPITHKMLKEAKVPCGSCHFEMIQASGGGDFKVYFEGNNLKTAMVVNAGGIKKENCLACHDQEMELKEVDKMELMHREHVTLKTARCFDCHTPITHTKSDRAEAQSKPFGCTACHEDPHTIQRILRAGPTRGNISEMPDPMFKARANCLACHNEKKTTKKGYKVLTATANACIRCHGPDYEQMFGLWQREIDRELTKAQRLEKEAIDALNKSKPELSQDKLDTANQMLKEARENLRFVERGNGMHNSKYSIEILDKAITDFKDMTDYVQGKESNESFQMEE
jgi:hypothetical protein